MDKFVFTPELTQEDAERINSWFRTLIIALCSIWIQIASADISPESFVDVYTKELKYSGCSKSHYYLYDNPILGIAINTTGEQEYCPSDSQLLLLDDLATRNLKATGVAPKGDFSSFPVLHVDINCSKFFNFMAFNIEFPIGQTRAILKERSGYFEIPDSPITLNGEEFQLTARPSHGYKKKIHFPYVEVNTFRGKDLGKKAIDAFEKQIRLIGGLYKKANPEQFPSCCDQYVEAWESEKASGCPSWAYGVRQ